MRHLKAFTSGPLGRRPRFFRLDSFLRVLREERVKVTKGGFSKKKKEKKREGGGGGGVRETYITAVL